MAGFFSKLFGDAGEPPQPDADSHEAVAALLVEAALADGIYAELESDVIIGVLVKCFEMDAETAKTTLKRGEALAEAATDTHALTRRVKTLPKAARIGVLEGLYRVSLADGDACKFEDAFIRHVASLLHIDDISRANARKRARQAHDQMRP